MRTLAQIQVEIDRLLKEGEAVRTADQQKRFDGLVGRCFRYEYTYGWSYFKVTAADAAKGRGLTLFRFEIRNEGSPDDGARVQIHDTDFGIHGETVPITEAEFDAAWKGFQKYVSDLRP